MVQDAGEYCERSGLSRCYSASCIIPGLLVLCVQGHGNPDAPHEYFDSTTWTASSKSLHTRTIVNQAEAH